MTKQVTAKLHIINNGYNAFFSTFGYGGIRNRPSGEPWQWVMILNSGTALPGFLIHVARTRITLDAKTWPTLEEVGALLAEWHRADEEYRTAWESLPEEQKQQMQEHRPQKRTAPEASDTRRYINRVPPYTEYWFPCSSVS